MVKFGLVQVVLSCCAGVCLLGVACSSEDDDGGTVGRGGTGAVAGSATGGRAGGGAAGGAAGEGNGGTSVAGSGGTPEGGLGGGGGQGGACDEDVTNGTIQLTLTEYCRRDNTCPRTLEAARANVTTCREYQYSEEATLCGLTVVSFNAEDHGRGFVFDGGVLVGAYSYNEVVEPPCYIRHEVGGVSPPQCIATDRCRICDQEDGAGGAGPFCDFGAGGVGGEGGR